MMITLDVQPEAVSGELAALVVKALDEDGVSQRRAAEASNVATTSFNRKLQGDEKYEISLTELLRIATLLDRIPYTFLPEVFKSCPCGASTADAGPSPVNTSSDL